MFVDFNILNQLGSPSINSNTFANRPSAGQVGRLFVSTDTFEIYRDNGTGWDLIGGPGSSTVTGSGAAGQVTYWTGTNSVGGENNLWWDAANNRFGVNTNTPTAAAEVVQTDGVALYSNFTTNAGSGTGTTALWAINNTNSSGYAAVIEEKTPNTTAGQYPLVVKHSLSSGTAGVGMGTGLHFQLPDDAGTYKTTQLTIETIDAAAATYKTRYRFMVQNNGSSTAVAYLNSTGLGLFTATPGAALDVHSTGTIAQFNTTSGTGNTYVAFQRTGTGIWRIGDTYNGGNNFFELHNTVLGVDAMEFQASTNKSTFQAQETYSTGQARGNYFDYNLSVAAGGSFSSPNAITSLGASLDLTLAGNATIPSGARSGLDAYNTIAFTGTGTLTQNQGSQLRTYANLTTGWAFNGSATGTITHLSGIHVRFPDNTGSAVTITNNYGLLINDQTANTGTVTYTNRWGVYQEGASDLNYFASNVLVGTTTNAGYKLDVAGTSRIAGPTGSPGLYVSGNMNGNYPSQNEGICFGQNFQAGIVDVGFWNTYSPSVFPNTRFAWYQQTGASSSDLLMTLLNTGHLGLGITPSAWLTTWRAIELPGGSFYTNAGGTTGQIAIAQNWYYDGAVNRYINSAAASDYYQFNGSHVWSNAPSGTAGSAVTFTERLRINSNGYLLTNGLTAPVGTAITTSVEIKNASGGTASNGYGIVSANNELSGGIVLQSSSTNAIGIFADPDNLRGSSSIDFYLDDAVTSRMRVNNTGNVLIGTTTDAGQKLQVAGTVLSDVASVGQQVTIKAGTKQTTQLNLQNDAITLGMVRINVPASTTTNLVNGYGGAIALISTTGGTAPNDYQYTFFVTWGWSSASVLFSNSYGANTFTATFSANSGVLQVNHNGGTSVQFSVSVMGVNSPFAG